MMFQPMKSRRAQAVALILIGLISLPVRAGVIPGRWEKVAALDLGTPIAVEFKNGDRVEGDFNSLSASEMELKTHSVLMVIPKADIQTITTLKEDGLADGTLKGAAISVAASFGLAFVTSPITEKSGDNVDNGGLGLVIGVAIIAGIGAAIGRAVDAATKTEAIVVYLAPKTP